MPSTTEKTVVRDTHVHEEKRVGDAIKLVGRDLVKLAKEVHIAAIDIRDIIEEIDGIIQSLQEVNNVLRATVPARQQAAASAQESVVIREVGHTEAH